MDQLLHELSSQWPSAGEMAITTFRLLVAAVAGALPGLQRERMGVAAGLRTHLLVSLGAAVFVIGSLEAGASSSDVTRVIQGLATGIGFVGAGAILKWTDRPEVQGLTTAASVWLTAALGTAAGLGRIWLPLVGSAMAYAVLAYLRRVDAVIHGSKATHPRD